MFFVLLLHELFRTGVVEVAEVGGVDHAGMRTERVLDTVEVEVAIGDGGILGDGCHKVLRETVARIGTCHGEHAGDAVELADHTLAVAWLCDDEELAEALVALHHGDCLVQ